MYPFFVLFRRLLTVVLFYGMVSAIFFDGLFLEVMDWRENGMLNGN